MIRPQAARRQQQHVGQCAVKWDRNLKPKLAIMRQCTSVTDRRTDGLASWHKREMYILHLALKTTRPILTKFLCIWLVAMARSSSNGVAMRWVIIGFLRMISRFYSIGPTAWCCIFVYLIILNTRVKVCYLPISTPDDYDSYNDGLAGQCLSHRTAAAA